MPVIKEDIKVADEIWKADLSSLKGKSVREKPVVIHIIGLLGAGHREGG